MSNLGRNLRAIAARDPATAGRLERAVPESDVVISHVSSEAVTLRVGGRLEASAIDPDADGARTAAELVRAAHAAAAQRVVVFGIGVYTLRHLVDLAHSCNGRVLVIEPSLAVARAVIEHVDLADALGACALIVGDDVGAIIRHPVFSSPERGVLLSHAPARHRARELFDRVASVFSAGGDARPLDIAVVPPLYGGSLPVAHAAARALRSLGHRVRELDLAAFLPAYECIRRATADLRLTALGDELGAGLTRLIGEHIVVSLTLDPPDVVLALAQAPLDVETLAKLRRRDIVSAFWFCEDAHVMPYWQHVCESYDAFFHLQPDVLSSALDGRGVYNLPLPMAVDESVHRPVELSDEDRERYRAAVSFVGAGYHNRIEWLPALADLGLRVYGTGWPTCPPFDAICPEPNQRQSGESTNRIFNAASINLNLHSSPWTDGVNPAGDYLNPRVYEIAGAGAFQLVDARRDLPAAFTPGVEIETYADLRECRRKIAHYLAHPDEAVAIAERGRARALSEHTYRHRMQTACEALRAGPRPAGLTRRARPTVAAAIESVATDHPRVAAVLGRIPGDRTLDADAITDVVALGDGELREEEKILLFMREAMSEVRMLNAGGDPA